MENIQPETAAYFLPGGPCGVVLVHGYTGTPMELRPLGDYLAAQGFTVGNIMTNGLRSLPDALNADGNAVFSTLQQLAGAIGTSVVSTIVAAAQQKYPDDMATGTMCGTQNAFVLLLAMSAVMAFCAVMAVRRSKT